MADEWNMGMEHCRIDTDRENWSTGRKIFPPAILSIRSNRSVGPLVEVLVHKLKQIFFCISSKQDLNFFPNIKWSLVFVSLDKPINLLAPEFYI